MTVRIFVSLSTLDHELAVALRQLFQDLFGDAVEFRFSTNKIVNQGIPAGGDWFHWTVDQAKECHFALILVTPVSLQNPRVVWEAGAICGAAASGVDGVRKIRPLLYRVEPDQIPEPIRASNAQAKRGDDAREIEELLQDFATSHLDALGERAVAKLPRLGEFVRTYMKRVDDVFSEARTTDPSTGDDAGESPRDEKATLAGKILDTLTSPTLLEELRRVQELGRQNASKLDVILRHLGDLVRGPDAAPADPTEGERPPQPNPPRVPVLSFTRAE